MAKIVLDEVPRHRDQCPMYEIFCRPINEFCYCQHYDYEREITTLDDCPYCTTIEGSA